MDAREPEDLQLPYLVTFSKAAELSNFSGAAKALRLSQAAVSQRIQALEKTLGKSLFKRKGGRVLLTGAGQKLYEYAQRILDLHRETRREVTGHETPKGLSAFPEIEFDVAVTMGCEDQRLFLRTKHREDWNIPCPKAMLPEQFQMVRDEIKEKVRDLLARLVVLTSTAATA